MTKWTEWTGGKCPIPDAKAGEYEVKFRGDMEGVGLRKDAIDIFWGRYHGRTDIGDIIAYRLIEKEQSDLDWLEGAIEKDLAYWTKNHNPKHEFTKGVKASHKDILHLIKSRKEAEP